MERERERGRRARENRGRVRERAHLAMHPLKLPLITDGPKLDGGGLTVATRPALKGEGREAQPMACVPPTRDSKGQRAA